MPEVAGPNAVHQHARRQRILRTRDRFREFEASAAFRKRIPIRRNHTRRLSRHIRPTIALIAANEWFRADPKLASEKIQEWTGINKEVVYIFLGRYFMRGLMAGALKG